MAIRFTPEYNSRISRIVKNYNARIRFAHRMGTPLSQLPKPTSVRNLKKSYSSKTELDRELKNLELFSRKSSRVAEVKSETNFLTKYNLDLIQPNRRAAINYYQKMVDVLEPKIKKGYYAETERLDRYNYFLKLLKTPISKLDYYDLKNLSASIENYRVSHERRSAGYRGFLTELDFVFGQTGVPKEKQDEFFKKLSVLDENEFAELYENNDIIERVYDMADSPEYGEMKLNMTIDDATERIETLLETIDVMIAEQVAKRKK